MDYENINMIQVNIERNMLLDGVNFNKSDAIISVSAINLILDFLKILFSLFLK